jgi:hypothetical protein
MSQPLHPIITDSNQQLQQQKLQAQQKESRMKTRMLKSFSWYGRNELFGVFYIFFIEIKEKRL